MAECKIVCFQVAGEEQVVATIHRSRADTTHVRDAMPRSLLQYGLNGIAEYTNASLLDKYFQYNKRMDINKIIARRINELRETQKLSLDALAALSGVSRSNISLIERGQSSASATVLDKLAAALGVTLSSLFEDNNTPTAEPSPISRAADQLVWTDPASGYLRRNLSPAAPSSIQLVEVIFPPGQRVVYDSALRNSDINQQIWMIEGVMEITVGDQHWCLQAGDCLATQLDQAFVYFNPTQSPAHYIVALATPQSKPIRRNDVG